MYDLLKFVVRIYWLLLLACFALFVWGCYYLYVQWGQGAGDYSDNILIELIVGGAFSVIPLYFGIMFGRKYNEMRFYENIKSFVKNVQTGRLKGDIKKPAARLLIREFSKIVGENVLKEPWYEKLQHVSTTKIETDDCGICGLPAKIEKIKTGTMTTTRCASCKLNCCAWQI